MSGYAEKFNAHLLKNSSYAEALNGNEYLNPLSSYFSYLGLIDYYGSWKIDHELSPKMEFYYYLLSTHQYKTYDFLIWLGLFENTYGPEEAKEYSFNPVLDIKDVDNDLDLGDFMSDKKFYNLRNSLTPLEREFLVDFRADAKPIAKFKSEPYMIDEVFPEFGINAIVFDSIIADGLDLDAEGRKIVPETKIFYPEPFIASPSFVHEELWFMHVLHFQHWLWFMFISLIMFYFITFVNVVRWCNLRTRPRRETRGVSRSKCADTITACVPVIWALAIIISETVDATDYNDGADTGEILIGIRAYQWGWEYYYPKSIDLDYNVNPSYSALVGNSSLYMNSYEMSLESNDYWQHSKINKLKKLNTTPLHLLISPSDKFNILDFSNIRDSGLNLSTLANSFKKIHTASKNITTNNNIKEQVFEDKYSRIKSLYIRDDSLLSSSHLVNQSQHSFSSRMAFSNYNNHSLDSKSFHKYLMFNKLTDADNKKTNHSSKYHKLDSSNTLNSSTNQLKATHLKLSKLGFEPLSALDTANTPSVTEHPLLFNPDAKAERNNKLDNLLHSKSNNEFDKIAKAKTIIVKARKKGEEDKVVPVSPIRSLNVASSSLKNFLISDENNNLNPSFKKNFIKSNRYHTFLNKSSTISNTQLPVSPNHADYDYRNRKELALIENSLWDSIYNPSKYKKYMKIHRKMFVDKTKRRSIRENLLFNNSLFIWSQTALHDFFLKWDLYTESIYWCTGEVYEGVLDTYGEAVTNRVRLYGKSVDSRLWLDTYARPFIYNHPRDTWMSHMQTFGDISSDRIIRTSLASKPSAFNPKSNYTNSIFSKQYLSNSSFASPARIYLNASEKTTSSFKKSYSNLKKLNYWYDSANTTILTNYLSQLNPHSYLTVAERFKEKYREFHLQHGNLNHSINTENSQISKHETSKVVRPLNVRVTTKGLYSMSRAMQKVFRSRYDENRSYGKLRDMSNSGDYVNLITSPKVPFKKILSKSGNSFFDINLYKVKPFFDTNETKLTLNTINTTFSNLPFLVSFKSDASRYLWFDWSARWSSVEVQPSSSSKYSLLGLPHLPREVSDPEVKDEAIKAFPAKVREPETYWLRLSRARKNYMNNWSYTPYFTTKLQAWYNKTAVENYWFDTESESRYQSMRKAVFLSRRVLRSGNMFTSGAMLPASQKSTVAFSSVNSPARSSWRPMGGSAGFGYNSQVLPDLLTKREFIYKQYYRTKGCYTALPKNVVSSPLNPLFIELQKSYTFNDPINFSGENFRTLLYSNKYYVRFIIAKEFYNYLNLETPNSSIDFSRITTMSFFKMLNRTDKNLLEGNRELYKNQFRPMKKGVTNMIRLHSTGAIAMPIEIRVHIMASSRDIIHSWAIPSAGVKIDCIPGYTSHRVTIFLVSGIFWGQCMEICGRYHHWMPIVVYFLKRDLFFLWCTHFIHYNTRLKVFDMTDRQLSDLANISSYKTNKWLSEVLQNF